MSEKVKYELKYTEDLSIFDVDPDNRDVYSDWRERRLSLVKANMRKNGFLPDKAISVRTGKNGKFIVRAGQGRMRCAKELGIGVWYIVNDDFNGCITEFEGLEAPWNCRDYIGVYVRKGVASYIELSTWARRNEIPIQSAASLLIGNHARAGNAHIHIKSGTFKIKDRSYADRVANIIMQCRAVKPESVNISFIDAVSKCCRVSYFNESTLIDRIEENPTLFVKCNTADKAVKMIQELYNYRTRDKKRHLAADVDDIMAKRRALNVVCDGKNRSTRDSQHS